jgi:2-alkyl-3-oxoalkanoate reductase
VVALARAAQMARAVEAAGAKVAIADALDKDALMEAVRRAEPKVIIHQLTALAGSGNFKKFDEEFALTNRFRTEVTDVLMAAARELGTRRFIAQSFFGLPYARETAF